MKDKGKTDYLKLVEDVVREMFIKNYELHESLDLEKPLRYYGVDSLDILDLLMYIEDEIEKRTKGIYSFEFPDETPFDNPRRLTLENIIDYAKRQVSETGGEEESKSN